MTRVLILRPEPGASETLGRAREAGLEAVAAPLFEVEPLDWDAPEAGGFDGLLLTSANAVRLGGAQLSTYRGLPVHAVGRATADAAREAGFDIASTGDSGVDRLLGSIEPDVKLLHLCGEDRTPTDARQEIIAVPVYRARAIEDPDLSSAPGGIVLLHSPRAARRFDELAGRLMLDRGQIALAAISAAALDAAGEGWAEAQAAGEPNDGALLALAARLCNNSAPR